MIISRHVYGYKIKEIASCLSGIKPNAVSTTVIRSVKRLNIDQKFQKLYCQLLDVINKN